MSYWNRSEGEIISLSHHMTFGACFRYEERKQFYGESSPCFRVPQKNHVCLKTGCNTSPAYLHMRLCRKYKVTLFPQIHFGVLPGVWSMIPAMILRVDTMLVTEGVVHLFG